MSGSTADAEVVGLVVDLLVVGPVVDPVLVDVGEVVAERVDDALAATGGDGSPPQPASSSDAASGMADSVATEFFTMSSNVGDSRSPAAVRERSVDKSAQ